MTHPTIAFLKALGKDSVFIRSWQGKGYPEIPDRWQDKSGESYEVRAWNVQCDRTKQGLEGQRWTEGHWDRMILELTRQNDTVFKQSKTYPYRAGGWCPYAVIANGGHKQADIADCPALFLEFDAPVTKEEAMHKVAAFPLDPSILIESRSGYHLYWLLQKPTTPRLWRQLQWRLIECFESDAGIEDPSRVMRLPGFKHLKWEQEPFEIQMHICEADRKYALEDFDAVLPDVPEWRLRLERYSKPYNFVQDDRGQEWDIRNFKHVLQHYRENARREWDTAQCPVHGADGHSKDSLHINNSTGAFRCWNGCDSKEIYREVCRLSGWKRQEKQTRPLASETRREPNWEHGTEEPQTEESQQDTYLRFLESLRQLLEIGDQLEQEFRLEQVCKNYRVNQKLGRQIFEGMQSGLKPEQKSRFSLDEIFSLPDTALDWVLPGFLPQGELVLAAGQPKTGKSLLAVYEVALAVASGGKFLNVPVKQGKVLIYQLEESPPTIKRRMWRRGGFEEIRKAGLVDVITSGSLLELDKIEAQIKEFQPLVVIIDSLRNALADSEANPGSSEYARPVRRLQKLLIKLNTAGILIHHEKKSDGYSKGINRVADTLDLTAACWGIWQIEKTKEDDPRDPNRKLTTTPRDGEGAQYEIAIKEDGNHKWSWDFLTEVGVTWDLKDAEDSTIKILAELSPSGLSREELRRAVKEVNNHRIDDAVIYRAFNRLVDRQIISHRPATTDRRLWVYSMTMQRQKVAVSAEFGEDF